MRLAEEINLCNIVTGKIPLNPTGLAFVEEVKRGRAVGPIHVQPIVGRPGKFVLLRAKGRLQYLACKLLGMQKITVRYSPRLNRRVM